MKHCLCRYSHTCIEIIAYYMYHVMCIYTCITLLVKFQTSLQYSAARAFDPANKAIPNWIPKTIESVNDFSFCWLPHLNYPRHEKSYTGFSLLLYIQTSVTVGGSYDKYQSLFISQYYIYFNSLFLSSLMSNLFLVLHIYLLFLKLKIVLFIKGV